MNTYYHCKFFYLKNVTLGQKGEYPVYACEKEHNISDECERACPDFKQARVYSNG